MGFFGPDLSSLEFAISRQRDAANNALGLGTALGQTAQRYGAEYGDIAAPLAEISSNALEDYRKYRRGEEFDKSYRETIAPAAAAQLARFNTNVGIGGLVDKNNANFAKSQAANARKTSGEQGKINAQAYMQRGEDAYKNLTGATAARLAAKQQQFGFESVPFEAAAKGVGLLTPGIQALFGKAQLDKAANDEKQRAIWGAIGTGLSFI